MKYNNIWHVLVHKIPRRIENRVYSQKKRFRFWISSLKYDSCGVVYAPISYKKNDFSDRRLSLSPPTVFSLQNRKKNRKKPFAHTL